MNDNSDLLPNLSHEDAFEMQMRGYSRRQVDEFIARCRSQIRDLEQRLARSLDDSEELRRDLATARQQALGAKPAHEEVSERIAQILKLADDEARSQKTKAHEDIARQRNDAQQEADKVRAEAREQAERMLTAAQEQAERAITSARAEAEKTLTAARTEAENTTSDARKKSEAVLAGAPAGAAGQGGGNGPATPPGPAGQGGPAGPPRQAGPASPRPAAAAGASQSPPAPSQAPAGGPGSAPSQPDKRGSARTGVLDSDEHPDGIRLVPGSENLTQRPTHAP